MSVFDRLSRFLPRSAEPAKPDPMVQMGIMSVQGHLILLAPDSDIPGVTIKIVTVPQSLVERELAVSMQFERVQSALRTLPRSLRPRKRKPPVSPPGA